MKRNTVCSVRDTTSHQRTNCDKQKRMAMAQYKTLYELVKA